LADLETNFDYLLSKEEYADFAAHSPRKGVSYSRDCSPFFTARL